MERILLAIVDKNFFRTRTLNHFDTRIPFQFILVFFLNNSNCCQDRWEDLKIVNIYAMKLEFFVHFFVGHWLKKQEEASLQKSIGADIQYMHGKFVRW